jgi:hypothetical protein
MKYVLEINGIFLLIVHFLKYPHFSLLYLFHVCIASLVNVFGDLKHVFHS